MRRKKQDKKTVLCLIRLSCNWIKPLLIFTILIPWVMLIVDFDFGLGLRRSGPQPVGYAMSLKNNQPPLILTRERGRVALRLTAIVIGKDLAVALDGGDRPHIGAVAVSQPRPSLEDPAQVSASTSVITLAGHKEDLLARSLAAHMAAQLDSVVTVACGIHLDRITGAELRDVQELAEALVEDLLVKLPWKP